MWLFYWIWPVAKNPARLRTTLALLQGSVEDRRAVAYGSDLHQFLQFCKEKLPPGSTFRLVGIDDASIEKVRAFYFLFPCLVSKQAEYILVYNNPTYREGDARLFAALNPSRFILRAHGLP